MIAGWGGKVWLLVGGGEGMVVGWGGGEVWLLAWGTLGPLRPMGQLEKGGCLR